MTKIFIILLFIAMPVLSIAQYNDNDNGESVDPRIEELKQYMWAKPDSSFSATEIPKKWEGESAVIIARQTESSVRKKSFSSKLFENFYYHERIKLLDDNAVKKYTEFSFNKNAKRYRGMFSFEETKRYVGFKVEKPDGTIEEVDLSEAVEKEVSIRRHSYAYKKIAIPNLQVGDIIDYYYCTEHVFPTGSFYEFSPIYYQFQEEYPIIWQKLKVDVLRGCYLNAKSINGAPSLTAAVDSTGQQEVSSFELVDTYRDKLVEEDWSNLYKEMPALKMQLFYTTSGILSSGYQSFFQPLLKMKSEVNVSALPPFTYQRIINVSNGYSPYRPMCRLAIKYLKQKAKTTKCTDDQLVKEAYYFLREYWYQQQFFVAPQIYGYNRYNFDNYTLTYVMSMVLMKLKIDHEVLYIMPKTFTGPDDLLFFGELYPAIRSLSQDSLIIADVGATKNYFEMPGSCYGSSAYVVPITGNDFNKLSQTVLPSGKPTDNKGKIISQINFNEAFDSISVKSRFELSGNEKAGWDSVMFVHGVIKDEFKRAEYGAYIKDLNIAFNNRQVNKEKELEEINTKEEKERKDKIVAKLKDIYGISEVQLNGFNVLSYGRWSDEPQLIFELDYTMPSSAHAIGNSIIFNTGCLTTLKASKLNDQREYDVYLPNKMIKEQEVIITGLKNDEIAGLEDLNKSYNSDPMEFNSSYQISGDSLIIKSSSSLLHNYIKKEDWQKVLDYNSTVDLFSNVKLKIPTTINEDNE